MDASHGAGCPCCAVDVLDNFLRASDALVAKALVVSEVAQIARIEARTRELLLKKWNIRSTRAAADAGRAVSAGGTLQSAYSKADAVMAGFASDVRTNYKQNLSDVYKLARVAGAKKASGKTSASLQYRATTKAKKPKAPTASVSVKFDQEDRNAIEALSAQELMWVGEVYANVAPTIRTIIDLKLLKGLSKAAAGKLVEDALSKALDKFSIPGGFRGTSERYFEALAANAVTNSRVQGQLASFSRIGITTYEIVNPMDERTSEICEEMNGQTFQVSDAIEQLAAMRAATTPEEYRAAHPWVSVSEIREMKASGTAALIEGRQMFPPYHFSCRSTVDVAEESLSFDALAD